MENTNIVMLPVMVGFEAGKKLTADLPNNILVKKVFRTKGGIAAQEPRFISVANPLESKINDLLALFADHPFIVGAMVDAILDTTGVLASIFHDQILDGDGNLLNVTEVDAGLFTLDAINAYLQKEAIEKAANSGVKLNASVIDQFFTDSMGKVVRDMVIAKHANAPETTVQKAIEQFTGLFKRLVKGQLANIDSLNALTKLLSHTSLTGNDIAVALQGRVNRAIDNLNANDGLDLI